MPINSNRPVDDECESRRMLEVALPGLYHINSFRILGLPVTATLRELDRQQKKIALLHKLGAKDWAVNCGCLAIAPSPSAEMIRKARQRIFNPENRLIDELFWFWPIEDQNVWDDEGLKLLIANDLNGARSLWQQFLRDKNIGYIALHNLAILHHVKALDIELESIKRNSRSELNTGRLWQNALHYWFLLSKDEQLWRHLIKRALALDDPRVSEATVSQMRRAFPKVIIAISAHLDWQAAESGKAYPSRRHRGYLDESGFDQKIYFNILEFKLSRSIEQIKMICERNKSQAKFDPDKAAVMAERIHSESLNKLNEIGSILDREHFLRKKANDLVAQAIRDCMLTFWNKTKDTNRCLQLTVLARNLSMDDNLRAKLNKELKYFVENQKVEMKAEKEAKIRYAKLKNSIDKNFVYEVALDHRQPASPVFCTCCLKETNKKQEIKNSAFDLGSFNKAGRNRLFSFPVCQECLEHQKEYQSKRAIIILLSAALSILIFPTITKVTGIAFSPDWLPGIPMVGMSVLLFSSMIRISPLKEGHACRTKSVKLSGDTEGNITFYFHNPLFADAFATMNKVEFMKIKCKKPPRKTFVLNGKGGLSLFIISIVIYVLLYLLISPLANDPAAAGTANSENNKVAIESKNIICKENSESVKKLVDGFNQGER